MYPMCMEGKFVHCNVIYAMQEQYLSKLVMLREPAIRDGPDVERNRKR